MFTLIVMPLLAGVPPEDGDDLAPLDCYPLLSLAGFPVFFPLDAGSVDLAFASHGLSA